MLSLPMFFKPVTDEQVFYDKFSYDKFYLPSARVYMRQILYDKFLYDKFYFTGVNVSTSLLWQVYFDNPLTICALTSFSLTSALAQKL